MEMQFQPQPKPVKQEKKKPYNSLQTSQSKPKKKSHLREWLNSEHSLNHTRSKPTRKERGEVNKDTHEKVLARDGHRCVCCGARQWEQKQFKGVPFTARLEAHHIKYRSHMGEGNLRDLATACGPPTQSGTCHHWAHSTKKGREWFEKWREDTLDETGNYKTNEKAPPL